EGKKGGDELLGGDSGDAGLGEDLANGSEKSDRRSKVEGRRSKAGRVGGANGGEGRGMKSDTSPLIPLPGRGGEGSARQCGIASDTSPLIPLPGRCGEGCRARSAECEMRSDTSPLIPLPGRPAFARA